MTIFRLLISIPANFVKYWVWRMRYNGPRAVHVIRRTGARISYTCYGEGAPVILLHGGLGRSLDWFSQTPALVTSGRRVILIDSRGHGTSTMGHGNYSYRALASDVVAVMDACGIVKSDILGWSDGGNIALLLARYSPARVARMVLISANFSSSGLTESARDKITRDPVSSRIRRWISGTNKPALVRQMHQLWQTRPQLSRADLHTIVTPTLVLVGDKDDVDLGHTRIMASTLPNAVLAVLQRTGHAAPITRAQQVNHLTLGFFDDDNKGFGNSSM